MILLLLLATGSVNTQNFKVQIKPDRHWLLWGWRVCLIPKLHLWAPESLPGAPGIPCPEKAPGSRSPRAAYLMSKRSSKAMKIPVGREPGLVGGREAGTWEGSGTEPPAWDEAAQGGGRGGSKLTRYWVPNLGLPVLEQSLGAKGVANTATCRQKSCFSAVGPLRTMRKVPGVCFGLGPRWPGTSQHHTVSHWARPPECVLSTRHRRPQ